MCKKITFLFKNQNIKKYYFTILRKYIHIINRNNINCYISTFLITLFYQFQLKSEIESYIEKIYLIE